MFVPQPYTLNIRGRLLDLSEPQVMGILNVTPDSFYEASRKVTAEDIRRRAEQIVAGGGTMIDVGACSSRPGAEAVTTAEEMRRLRMGVSAVREVAPEIPLSVDTFRADVARMAVEELGADIVNDISGGELDKAMSVTVARMGVPYVLMHMRGTPQTMQQQTEYENVAVDVMRHFARKVQQLRDLGQKDIIIDPGYGFAKTLEQNYELLRQQEELRVLGLPILVGLSRKSMIYRLLDSSPEQSLNGTTVLNTIALTKGANILRVHDVREAVECVRLVKAIRTNEHHD